MLTINGELMDAHELKPWDLFDYLHSRFERQQISMVVCEAFTLYGGPVGASKFGSQLPEVELIGAIKALARIYGVLLHLVPAAQYKALVKQWASPPEVKGDHVRDAYTLGMWYLAVKAHQLPFIKLKDGREVRISEQK